MEATVSRLRPPPAEGKAQVSAAAARAAEALTALIAAASAGARGADDTGECLNISELAARLSVHRDTARKLVDSGDIPVVHVGSQRRVRVADLLAYLDRNTS